jgi:hypothetical protein
MSAKELIIHEIPNTPEPVLREVYDFLIFLKARSVAQTSPQPEDLTALAESSWAKDWNRPEEDEAWKDL